MISIFEYFVDFFYWLKQELGLAFKLVWSQLSFWSKKKWVFDEFKIYYSHTV